MQAVIGRKKKKKQAETAVLLCDEVAQSGLELQELLGEMASEHKYLDVNICPKCKSPKVKRAPSEGDPGGHMGITPPKYVCEDCGCSTSIQLKATNRPLSVKEVELILEAREIAKE